MNNFPYFIFKIIKKMHRSILGKGLKSWINLPLAHTQSSISPWILAYKYLMNQINLSLIQLRPVYSLQAYHPYYFKPNLHVATPIAIFQSRKSVLWFPELQKRCVKSIPIDTTCLISSPNPMLDYLLESSPWDDCRQIQC